MVKSMIVSDETWKKLMYIKVDNNFKSMEEVIEFLLNKDGGGKNG